MHPQIQTKILAKIQAAKQRQIAVETADKYNYNHDGLNNSAISSHSPYPLNNSNYFYSHTLNQLFHIQNHNNVNSKKLFQDAVRWALIF